MTRSVSQKFNRLHLIPWLKRVPLIFWSSVFLFLFLNCVDSFERALRNLILYERRTQISRLHDCFTNFAANAWPVIKSNMLLGVLGTARFTYDWIIQLRLSYSVYASGALLDVFVTKIYISFSGVCYGAVNGQHKSFELHHVGKSRFLQVVTGCWQNEQMGKLLAQFWTILVFIQAQGFICLLLFTHPLVFGGKKSNQSVVTHRNTFLSQMFSQSSCSHISLLWLQEGKLFKSEKDWKKGAFSLLIFSNTICFQKLICLHSWTRRCPYMAIKWCVRKSWALKKIVAASFIHDCFPPIPLHSL